MRFLRGAASINGVTVEGMDDAWLLKHEEPRPAKEYAPFLHAHTRTRTHTRVHIPIRILVLNININCHRMTITTATITTPRTIIATATDMATV